MYFNLPLIFNTWAELRTANVSRMQLNVRRIFHLHNAPTVGNVQLLERRAIPVSQNVQDLMKVFHPNMVR
ncbi:MAG: hypothetical protein M1119_04365 [Firmicutes bacterium]|nr:hypothetical protein [Bacillota bacterium]